MNKTNRIKGGIYSGPYWFDFVTHHDAKKIAHKQERARVKKAQRKEI